MTNFSELYKEKSPTPNRTKNKNPKRTTSSYVLTVDSTHRTHTCWQNTTHAPLKNAPSPHNPLLMVLHPRNNGGQHPIRECTILAGVLIEQVVGLGNGGHLWFRSWKLGSFKGSEFYPLEFFLFFILWRMVFGFVLWRSGTGQKWKVVRVLFRVMVLTCVLNMCCDWLIVEVM